MLPSNASNSFFNRAASNAENNSAISAGILSAIVVLAAVVAVCSAVVAYAIHRGMACHSKIHGDTGDRSKIYLPSVVESGQDSSQEVHHQLSSDHLEQPLAKQTAGECDVGVQIEIVGNSEVTVDKYSTAAIYPERPGPQPGVDDSEVTVNDFFCDLDDTVILAKKSSLKGLTKIESKDMNGVIKFCWDENGLFHILGPADFRKCSSAEI
eukprot:gene35501-46012_t